MSQAEILRIIDILPEPDTDAEEPLDGSDHDASAENELALWVKKGHINQKQLIRFMAQVGYNTYKDDKKFMLPDGSNDNPILNPSSSRVSLGFDSTQYDSAFWHDFKQWKKEHPALVDSITRATDSLIYRNPVPPHPKRK